MSYLTPQQLLDTITMKQYVNPKTNTCPNYLRDHISVGNKVIVIDGSYMTSENKGETVYGKQFKIDLGNELLTVTKINVSFETNYYNSNALAYHNNCEIIDDNGKKFYCSKINIIRYEYK